MLTAQELLETNGIKLKGYWPGKYAAICPKCSASRSHAHQRTPCLGVKIDDQGATWRCNHCEWSGPEKGSAKSNGADGRSNGHDSSFTTTYDYPGFQKVRYPKGHDPRFHIRHRNDRGEWQWGAGGANTNAIYRREEIQEAIALGHPVLCVEGEKDADALWARGIAATCNSQGANQPGKRPKWTIEHSKQLADADLVVLGDHDLAGYAHQDVTCQLSLGIAKRVRILRLAEHWPDCPTGGDVSDWFDAGHTREQLDELIARAPDYKPKDDLGTNGDADQQRTNGDGARQQREQTKSSHAPPLKWLDMSNWDREPIPEREWAILNRVPLRQAGLFSGEGGTGKSIIELTKDVAHVAGKDWFGSMPERGPAFYIGAEDDELELHIRLAAIAAHYGVTFAELIEGGLRVLCLLGQDATLCAVSGKSGRVETTELYARVYEAAGDIKPKNISIDTLSRAFAGNEIDRVQVYAFAMHMQALAMVANGSVTVLSHPSLQGIASGSGISGSTAWHGAFRFRQYLTAAKPDNGERPDDNLRQIEVKKNQYGPRAETIVVRYQNGLFLPVPGIGSLERVAQEQSDDEAFLGALDQAEAQGRTLSDSIHASNYAPASFANAIGVPKARLTAAMERLFTGGKIHIVAYGPPSKGRRKLARKA
jgi:RecA-family ATPase